MVDLRYITIILLACGLVLAPVGLYLMGKNSGAIVFVAGMVLLLVGLFISEANSRGWLDKYLSGSSSSDDSDGGRSE